MTEREPLSTEPYKGVRDFYPTDYAVLSSVFATLREQLGLWGYEEYAASPLERAELYEAKTSEEIVSEQTYTFEDRGGRRVTLRPEMTPTLARMVAAKRRELVFPLRWFSIPNVFRYERPQRGRLREHYQLNVDILGLSGIEADIEVVAIAANILFSLGAKEEDFHIRINSRKLLTAACNAAGLTEEVARSYMRILDKKGKISREEYDARVAQLTNTDPLSLIVARHSDIQDASDEITKVQEALNRLGVRNTVSEPTITRGFDYYTGIVFEVFDTDPENSRSLFGGGRYDGLVAAYGSEPIPAVGFGMGDVTLLDFLTTHNLLLRGAGTPDLYLGTLSSEDIPYAQELAQQLRAQGIRTFVNLTVKSIGDQVKDADRRNIPYFAAFGPEERDSGTLKLKELATGDVTEVTAEESASVIKK